MSNGTAEIKSSHLKTWALTFLEISSTYKSDTNAMNIEIILFVAWLALQPWRIGRMFCREIQHSNISPSSSILIMYTRISTCISELEGERSLQPYPLHGKNELKYEKKFFRSVQILRELMRITTFVIA
jgi:hypothetical protein